MDDEHVQLIPHVALVNEGDDEPMLHHHENGDVIVDEDIAGALTGGIEDIKLEEGKEYHLFFCHSSVNLAWVVAVVKHLEAPPYNLKCAFSERDFLPGQNDMNEMFRCITGSMRTVFVLTPAFLDSRWCEWEMQMAQTASVANNISLLPIMLEDCPVPDTIKHINYIDLTNGDVPKAAVLLRKHIMKPGQGFIPQDGMLQANGSSFLLRETIKKNCCGGNLKFDLPPNGREELEQRGIAITDETINDLLDTLNFHESGIRIIRTSFRCLPIYLCCGVILTVIATIWSGFWLTIVVGNSVNVKNFITGPPCYYWLFVPIDNANCSIARFVLTIGCICAVMPIIAPLIYLIVRERKRNRAINIVKKISLTALMEYNMYIWFGGTAKLMHIVKYDIGKCLQHMTRQLHPNTGIDGTDCWKQDLLKTEFPDYIEKLMQGGLNNASIVLHKTVNYRVCFCQYILMMPKYKHMFIEIFDDV